MIKQRLRTAVIASVYTSLAASAFAANAAQKGDGAPSNRYVQVNLVANKRIYGPQLTVEPNMMNAWGIAIRPKGSGGHFWVTAKDVSYQYVGDVSVSNDIDLQKLSITDVPYVKLPVGGDDAFATSVVFSGSTDNFVITQEIDGVEPVTAPAKFLFASDGGIISGWTERKKDDATFDRSKVAKTVIDQSKEGAQFFGLAFNAAYDRLYAANFGKNPKIEVFDGHFKPLDIAFDTPFDENENGKVDPGEYAPFNIQSLTTPDGDHHIFVTYAKTKLCTPAGIKEGACKKGEIFAGEEDTSKPGQGRVVEFNEDGKMLTLWKDAGHLSAPWGMAFAPANFGALSGKLLVANFGSGDIAAFDPQTHHFVDVVRDAQGKPVKIDGIWGLLFGNGVSLGDANALYFTSGPSDEKNGVFGSLRPVKK
ncbi:MAG: TIGR03118 family protein [Alphaproteobacteria bacterium]|nr:TIGR03118 family protein [Alphaproteobacteria bacterium]